MRVDDAAQQGDEADEAKHIGASQLIPSVLRTNAVWTRLDNAGGPVDEAIASTRTVDTALDAMVAAPDHHTILLENEHVRVLDTKLRPGETTPVHVHPWPSVLYVLSWSDFVRYDSAGNVLLDSRTQGVAPRVGSAIWAGPLPPHRASNVGTRDLHILAIEFKYVTSGGHTEAVWRAIR